MQTPFNRNTGSAAVAAVAIVGFTGLMLDRSLYLTYESSLPKGTVEIREILPDAAGDFAPPMSDVVGRHPVRLAETASDAQR